MRICLAPMDWITDCAYRCICKEIFEQYGKSDDELMLWTEFMSADGYFHNPSGVISHILKTDFDKETIAQIFGGNQETLLYTAQHLSNHYDFAGIELNMWCPSPKIMSCEAWSGMMKDKERTLGILRRMSEVVHVPFSIKTRIGLTEADIHDQFQFLIEASEYVHLITIHGRTYKQSHAGEVNREFIYRLKDALPGKIIIWNGGLRSYEDGKQKCWNLDGVMPGQSAIGNPRILTPHEPTSTERIQTALRHLDLACAADMYLQEQIRQRSWLLRQPSYAELQERAARIHQHPDAPEVHALKTPVEFRKYVFNYIKGLNWNKELKVEISKKRDYASLVWLLEWALSLL